MESNKNAFHTSDIASEIQWGLLLVLRLDGTER